MTTARDGGGEALAGALEYVAAGYAVAPVTLELDGRGKKVARFHTRWETDPAGMTRDAEQVKAWAARYPGCGWHAPCGPNGVVVVDGDVKRGPNGLKIADGVRSWRKAHGPDSPMTATTQSGGRHWYFRAPAEPIRNSAGAVEGAPHVDVRGDGGTVFITGTRVHGGGGFYVADRVVPVDELPTLPDDVAARLRAAGPAPKTDRKAATKSETRPRLVSASSVHDRGWIEATVDDALRELVRRGESDFRNHLFEAAAVGYRAVGCGVLEQDELEERLRDAIRRVWDAEPDQYDVQWVEEAREKAAADPWRLYVETPAAPPAPTEGEGEQDDVLPDPSWLPVDLGPHLDGTHVAPSAVYLEREDGVALLYPGLVHWLYGESESGKSWVGLIAAARVLAEGGRALVVDYESDPGAVVGRLRALGATTDAIRAGLTYVRPETSCDREPQAFAALLAQRYAVALVDGVTVGLGLEGGATNDGDDVSAWVRRIPLRIARATGAAVACVDHVTKDKEGRGRFPVGSQAKLAAVDGAGYLIEPKSAIRPGAVGEIELRVGKDRPGGVREHAGEWRQGDRTQEAARITIDATDPAALKVTVTAPATPGTPGPQKFSPTLYMERVSRFLGTTEGEAATKTIEQAVDGRADMIRKALDELALLGYVSRRTGPRNAVLYTHVKRYTDLQRVAHGEELTDDD